MGINKVNTICSCECDFVTCRCGNSQSRSKLMSVPSWIGNAPWLSIFGICFHQPPPFPGHLACMKKHFRYMCVVEPSNNPGSAVFARDKTFKSHFIILFLCFFWKYHKVGKNLGNMMRNFFLLPLDSICFCFI